MKDLFDAVRAGDVARVDALVAADPTLAIFAAAMLGDVARLDALLTANRSLVTAVSSDGWTGLHLAAFFGKTEAARLLLNRGRAGQGTVDERDEESCAACGGCGQTYRSHEVAAGVRNSSECSATWWMDERCTRPQQHGDIEMAKVLIESGANVSARADNQQRPLDLAVLKAHQAMVDFLEAKGASL